MGMDDLFGSSLGGSGGEGQGGGGDMFSSLLGMLGSGGGGEGNAMNDMLGALMGGGQEAGQSAGLPASSISQQTGIPPEIVTAVLSFLLGKLLGGGQQSGTSGPTAGSGLGLEELLGGGMGGGSEAAAGGINLQDLMQSMQGEQAGQYIESAGMHRELAQQTGMDPEQASQALQGVLGALRGK